MRTIPSMRAAPIKILNVVGARPNFVKIAPLLAEMWKYSDVRPFLVHTGQHYDDEMSGCFLRDLGIPAPDFVLNSGEAGPPLQKEQMTRALGELMLGERPDVVLVVGDVNSTAAAAIAAARLDIPVAHVEAGLRSFDRGMPEEINRIVTDAVSSLLFASEPSAVRNLIAEGQPGERIFLVGNVMIDTLRQFLATAKRSTILSRLGLVSEGGASKKYALATLHRPATVDDPTVFRRIWEALKMIAAHVPVVFPAHPRVQARLRESGLHSGPEDGPRGDTGRLQIVRPLPYLDFLRIESEAALVITDSGGVQEETTALGVPCLTVRNHTERPITVSEGTNQIVGLQPNTIREAAGKILSEEFQRGRIPRLWDGHSAERIVRILHRHFGPRAQPHLGRPPYVRPSHPTPLLPCLPASPSSRAN
jgi:UDP-N-acetylglucosamine 2-epimerase (non-hydrolysing)